MRFGRFWGRRREDVDRRGAARVEAIASPIAEEPAPPDDWTASGSIDGGEGRGVQLGGSDEGTYATGYDPACTRDRRRPQVTDEKPSTAPPPKKRR